MARANRFAPPTVPCHVVNRGNDRRTIYADSADYRAFLHLLRSGGSRFLVRVHGYCLMPNHFHLVLEPQRDGALSAYMQWVTGCYSCYLRARTGTSGSGHVFQRRFWSAAIRDDLHFLTVLRYVEANPRRAGLVTTCEDWPWSSLRERLAGRMSTPATGLRVDDWKALVNQPQPTSSLDELRREVTRPPGRRPAVPSAQDR